MNGSSPVFLAPLSLETFFADYWEQQPLHLARGEADSVPLVDFVAIESLLASQPLYYPGVQVTQADRKIDPDSYVDQQNRIIPLRLLEHYKKGATIILSQAQILFPTLNALCRDVMRSMKMQSQTNVYVSPPGNQGFNAHYDTHDVFVLQISGSKTFNFYPSSVMLPFPDEVFDASGIDPAAVDQSISLGAGDTLYIPRGVVHDAIAAEAEASIHVTLGVYPVLVRDFLLEAIQVVAEEEPELRRSFTGGSLKPGVTESPGLKPLQDLISKLSTTLRKPELIAQVQSRLNDDLALNALQDCYGVSKRGGLSPIRVSGWQGLKRVSLRQEMIIDFEISEHSAKIRTFGQVLEFSAPFNKLVCRLLMDGCLLPDDLASLSCDQRDAVLDRLLTENLIDIL